MKRTLAVLIALGLLSVYFFGKKAPIPPEIGGEPVIERTAAPVAGGTVSTPLPSPKAARPESSASIADSAPSPDDLRAEIVKDPHGRSQALVNFAGNLAPRMGEALADPAKADRFFDELRDCVRSPRLAASRTIRAICLSNIKALGARVPSLRDRAREEFEKADPEVARLAQ